MRCRNKIKNFFPPFRLFLSSLRMRGSMPWIPDQVGNDAGEVGGRGYQNDRNRAFSLIELMVVIAIFAIISGVIMFNYGRFSSNMIVTNLAYEAALAVRQAQVYGISVKKTTEGAKFDASYGVWFSESDKQNFYLFSDKDGDKMYDKPLIVGDPDLELEESFGFNGSNIIKNFCVTNSVGTRTCSSVSSELQYLSIIFTRPDPEAKIYAFNSASNRSGPYSKAEIMFTMARGDKIARMTVTNTGQMSIDSCNDIIGDTKECPK
jgi:prepilin-type N-terminal cleavage/methylation domain-containing protein